MNLSDLLLSGATGAFTATPVAAAKGENPQETALFDGFAQVFAVTVPVEGKPAKEDQPAASELADGNILPDVTGNILPGLAAGDAALPQAQQFSRDDSVLRASTRQASYSTPETPGRKGEQLVTAQPAQPGVAAAMPSPLLQTPGSAQAIGSQPQTQTQAQPQLQLQLQPQALMGDARAPLSDQAEIDAKIDPARTDAAAPGAAGAKRGLHIELALRPAIPPAFSSRAATPLAQAEAPAGIAMQAQAAPAAPAAAQVAPPVPIEHLLRPAARTAIAPQAPVEAEAAAPGGQQQGAAPAQAQAAQPAPLPPAPSAMAAPDALRAPIQPSASEATPAPAAAMQRHDFSEVVERLAQAREMARPGRAEMQVTHREFGPVSMQFDVTGNAMKVALTSAHAGFAPAVQAALAERPVTAPGEGMRADIPAQQQSQPAAQTTGQTTGSPAATTAHSGLGQSHGEAQHQRHHEAPRPAANGEPQPREQAGAGDGDTARRSNPRRDNALFA